MKMTELRPGARNSQCPIRLPDRGFHLEWMSSHSRAVSYPAWDKASETRVGSSDAVHRAVSTASAYMRGCPSLSVIYYALSLEC